MPPSPSLSSGSASYSSPYTPPSRLQDDQSADDCPFDSNNARLPSRSTRGQYRDNTVQRYGHNLLFALLSCVMLAFEATIIEPKSYKHAQKDKAFWQRWYEAMKMEFNLLSANKIWTLVPRSGNRRLLGAKWAYNLKRGPEFNSFNGNKTWTLVPRPGNRWSRELGVHGDESGTEL
ncbi:hypothetical protein E4U60_000609 [Claviceps pazoutovae]|uniref:Reverse transcriptase Ty1/copia-type domain-containing protein n=1 Tax=Claviceps pazoutovae TaxID=1649127 RepID=A0A9P7SLB0_9HYPO|nr:hypothetical protein E4U60_000609 [Claviceps pazoutovae]